MATTGAGVFSGMGKLSEPGGTGAAHRPPQLHHPQPPTGYSSAGCSPAEPASASPADGILESEGKVCQGDLGTNKKPLDTASPFQRWLQSSHGAARTPLQKTLHDGPPYDVCPKTSCRKPPWSVLHFGCGPAALRYLLPINGPGQVTYSTISMMRPF